VVFPLVPKLWLGNGLMGIEAGASAQLCSQGGAWEQEAKDLHPFLILVEGFTRALYPDDIDSVWLTCIKEIIVGKQVNGYFQDFQDIPLQRG